MRVFLSTHLQIKYQKFYWPIRDNIPNFTSPTLCMTILSGASLEIKQTRFLEALFGKSQFIMSYYYRSLNSIVKKHPSVGSSVWFIVLSKQRVGCTSFLTRFMKNILEVLWGATDGNIKILHCFHSNHCRTLRLFFNEIFDWSVLWKISAKKKPWRLSGNVFKEFLAKMQRWWMVDTLTICVKLFGTNFADSGETLENTWSKLWNLVSIVWNGSRRNHCYILTDRWLLNHLIFVFVSLIIPKTTLLHFWKNVW